MPAPPGVVGIVDPVNQVCVLRLRRTPWDPTPLGAHHPLIATPEGVPVEPAQGVDVPRGNVKPKMPPPQVGVGEVRLPASQGEGIDVPEVRPALPIRVDTDHLGEPGLLGARVLELLSEALLPGLRIALRPLVRVLVVLGAPGPVPKGYDKQHFKHNFI